jgi:leader peptidase (prepilin peptidase)/N-methyltransferase
MRGCAPIVEILAARAVWVGVAGILGAMVGSFLNVCIHRLPRELSLYRPARSFCPRCERTLPWFLNIPMVAWLCLRGRCAFCKEPISARYLLVECLSAALFAAATWRFGFSQPGVLVATWVLLAVLIAATFIDIEHLIIPDELTWGGVAAGLVCSVLWPGLHAESVLWHGLGFSLAGALLGYGLLWSVATIGRLVMGRQRFEFQAPVEALWRRTNDAAELTVDGDAMDWASLFFHGSEQVRMRVEGGTLDDISVGAGEWIWEFETLRCAGQVLDLNALGTVRARITAIVLPREVMGYGDVKFLAAIGAFLGWKAVLFSLLTGSILGASIGAVAVVTGRREVAARIPFGPYLAAGAVLWIFAGPALVGAYWDFVTGTGARPD